MKSYNDFKSFSKDQAYWERNQLICALSKVYPSWMELHPLEDKEWDHDWRHIIFIEIPSLNELPQDHKGRFGVTQQLSWHLHDDDVGFFNHLDLRNGNSWDKHTTMQKYWRLMCLRTKKWYQFWK